MDNHRTLESWVEEALSEPQAEATALALSIALAAETRRRELGLSYAQVARRMGVSRAYIHRVMQGSQNFTVMSLVKLSRALGLQLSVSMAKPQAAPPREVNAIKCRVS